MVCLRCCEGIDSIVFHCIQCFIENQFLFCSRFVAAARYYAESKISFEEVSLKFLTEGKPDALKTFLQKKLDSVHSKVGVST